jgi:plastocyanin
MRLISTLTFVLLAACGGDDGPPNNNNIDAQQADAAASVVALASCPATVAATMTTNASAFSPTSVTVPSGGVVKLMATSGHAIGPNTLVNTDSSLTVSQGGTKCFQFNTGGVTYGIMCTFHGFAGTITVSQ